MSEQPIAAVHVADLQRSGADADGDRQLYDDFTVRTFELVERLSEPYSLALSLATRVRQMYVPGLVGGRCWFRFGRGEFERDVHGLVFKAETIGIIQDKLCVRLWVVPALEVLRLSKRMRVFQGMTAAEIARAVCKPVFDLYEGSLDTSRVEHAVVRTRDCCVQYQETDVEFVQRLLAEEGIAFINSDGKVLGRDGKPIVDSPNPSKTEEAHIPLTDWLNWRKWNRP